jgi:thiamine biosynthesis lipoprotein
LRLATDAFGTRAEIEVRGLPGDRARQAIDAAFAAVAEVERLLAPSSPPGPPAGGLGALNAAAGRGPQPVAPGLFTLLQRAQSFCVWSEGAHGPLGRELYDLWGARAPVSAPPAIERLGQAVEHAACSRLTLDPAAGTATLAQGTGLELRGFAEGYATDRAVDALRQKGATNGFVQIGAVRRGFGPGPDGKGWAVMLPPFPDLDEPIGRVFLRNQALAVAATAENPLRVGGEPFAPFINLRTGQPAEGVVGTIAVTDLALDAQALSVTLAITGPREGRLRLGSLHPQPSVLWLLGSGTGAPLLVDHHWSALARR